MAISTNPSTPRCSKEQWDEFRHLVRHGMLFEVIAWIESGKPTLRPENKHASPLEDALLAPNLSMTQVLWERAWQEKQEVERAVFSLACGKRSYVVLRYLMEQNCPLGWLSGWDLCLSHDLDLIRLGMKRGVNILEPDGWASAFREVGSRPLIRFYLEERNRIPGLERDAVVAMCRCIAESRLRAIALLRWAGVNPLGKAPRYVSWEGAEEDEWDGFPALHIANAEKAEEILKLLKLKPSPPQWFEMIDRCSGSTTQTFAAVMELMPDPDKAFKKFPQDAGRLLINLLKSICRRYYSRSRDNDHLVELCLRILEAGIQPCWRDHDEINRFRRDLYQSKDQDKVLRVIARMADHANASTMADLEFLVNKPKMRSITRLKQPSLMQSLGLMPTPKPEPARHMLKKSGVRWHKMRNPVEPGNPPSTTPAQPNHRRYYPGKSIILKRDDIYAKVWSQPAMHVAKAYGISGSMLARICTELNVPRPPRGYWPRNEAERRRFKKRLPELKDGQADFWAVNPANVKRQRRRASK